MKWISGRRRGTVSRCVWDILLSSCLSPAVVAFLSFPLSYIPLPLPLFLWHIQLLLTPSLCHHSRQILETTTPTEVILQHTPQEIKKRQHSLVTTWSKAPPCFGSLTVLQSPVARLIWKQTCAAFFPARPHKNELQKGSGLPKQR